MNTRFTLWARTAVPLALCLAPALVAGQDARQQAQKELARPAPSKVEACTLITRADVKTATGRDPYVDAEAAGQGGWICSVGTAELKVYSGPQSWAAWESTLKGFKKENEPRTPAPAFGKEAYFLFLKAENRYADNVGFLVVKSGEHTLALSLDAAEGQPAETTRPALESLMKTIVSRLP